MTYISAVTHTNIGPALITILADKDYYSTQAETLRNAAPSVTKTFSDFNVRLTEAHKTGLGSSAALVTAFTAAVLGHYLPQSLASLQSDTGKARLHNLAQASHCAAQGKVGSGFDVAAAVYGSAVYRRFTPTILEIIGEPGIKGFSSRLKAVVDDTLGATKWDTQIEKSAAIIPRGLRLVMCDVECGSETVGLVKQVLAWRKANPEEAAFLWNTLQTGNEELAQELQRLALESSGPGKDYENLRAVILTIRSLIREMSAKAGVPIEPKVQTDLLDACSELPGVIGGVVPGAGGFDAIALLVEDDEATVRRVREFLNRYQVAASEANIGRVRLLGVKQELQGARIEDLEPYLAWIQ